jgi:hypothetical protein
MIQAIKSKFLLKAALGILLVILGDMLFYQQGGVGSNLGLFAGAWCTATVLALPALRSDKRSLVAAGLAAIYAVALSLNLDIIFNGDQRCRHYISYGAGGGRVALGFTADCTCYL